jgi:hypothetical protein
MAVSSVYDIVFLIIAKRCDLLLLFPRASVKNLEKNELANFGREGARRLVTPVMTEREQT